MNKRIRFPLLAGILFASFVNVTVVSNAQSRDAVTFQVFYDALAPYGKWLYDKSYGFVWTPSEGAMFRPYYTNGYWAMTEAGCTWVSNYPWGWAPFHYGRWVNDAMYHWIWVPGNKWAAAWVVWRTSGDYAGWTPITPNTRITTAMSPSSYYVPADWWVFVQKANLLKKDFQQSPEPSRRNNDLIRETPVNTARRTGETEEDTYLSGPRAVDFARSTGQKVSVYLLKSMDKPGKPVITREEISFYMPAVEESPMYGGQPSKYVNAQYSIGKAASLAQSGNMASKIPAAGATKTTKPAAKKKK